ncbi:MAG: Transaldolase [uncultured Phycisphaerae bacterium]|uniref:Transaldolase n=1 Tax=uncultured Phycisphaerae bacterium TaxID=904963 RepID=A0A6J4PF36_9BACT|nr:MAG: Transaldolase [uncultured Phycisphaerae bacterium]
MSLKSLIGTGTKLWLDSVDPGLVDKNIALGATGATSNPIIISDLLKTGRFDDVMETFFDEGMSDEQVAWAMTDYLVSDAQDKLQLINDETDGDDGYVSFELDPLLEDRERNMPHAERVKHYIELGKLWGKGYMNRMIKVPATPAGLDALEDLAAAGLALNVTLIFSERQNKIARENVWKGAQRRRNGLKRFKSVFSIFVSRVDVYTEKNVKGLSPAAQGQVGIVNAKQLWRANQQFWADKKLPLKQEIIFASTGTKDPKLPPDKYVEALAGADIQTNPPATNDAVEKLNKPFARHIEDLPPQSVLDDIAKQVDVKRMEDTLMDEGTAKFADPHKALLKLIKEKRGSLVGAK